MTYTDYNLQKKFLIDYMNMLNQKWLPLTVVIGFNLLTLFMFLSAPIIWATDNLYIFTVFFFCCTIMIIFGYSRGYNKVIKLDISRKIFNELSNKILTFIFLFYLSTFLIKYAYILKFSPFDITGMIQFLSIGFVDQHIGYKMSLDSTRPYTLNWVLYFFAAVINQIFFVIGFIKWKEMNLIKQFLFIIFVIIELFFWMGRGTNFGVVCLITTFAFVFIDRVRMPKKSFRKNLIVIIIIFILSLGSIASLTSTLKNRGDGIEIDFQKYNIGNSYVDNNAIIFSIMPESFHQSYIYVISYIAQGYYHTSLAFDLDFKSTYLLGNNPALINIAQILNIDLWANTYMYRLEEKFGIDSLAVWHSAYTWYANDVSFFGVPFVLFILGYLFGLSRNISLKYNDALSKVVFVIFGNMLLYLFANNTYLSSVFYSFIFIFPLWFFTRVKYLRISVT